MEMEHINENTIRVMIGHDDLEERGVSFLDLLLGNHREIENFFYSILEEVDIEEEFQSSEAVTFQVLPKGDGLELFISKNMPDEEIGQNNESTLNSADVSEFLQGQMLANEEESDLTESTTASEQRAIFVFDDFEQVIQLANDVQLESAWTDLYQLEERYYLVVHFWMESLNQTDVENQYARILEFAEKSTRTAEALNEYGQQLMERNALERVKFYFE